MRYDLGPRPYRLRSFAGRVMRVSDDLRRCVVFIGYSDGTIRGRFNAVGTGFLVVHKMHGYLVTAQHIAVQLGDMPFAVRFNIKDGSSANVSIDPIRDEFHWFYNTNDPSVDLAVIPFTVDWRSFGVDYNYLPTDLFATSSVIETYDIGIGDICYVIGLFRLMAGAKRNLPVVHTGNIALMPSDERIPVKDWLYQSNNASPKYVEGYLVELQNLQGLSGAPVFVRPLLGDGFPLSASVSQVGLYQVQAKVLFLGVWQGSWDASPDEIQAVEQGRPVRVPVGMGTVVPADKLMEILEMPALQALRDQVARRKASEAAASPDSAFVPPASPGRTEAEGGDDAWLDPAEAASRRDETLRRMLSTPPRPGKGGKPPAS